MDNKKFITIVSIVALILGLFAGVALIKRRFLPTRASLTPVDIVFSPAQITLYPGSTPQVVNVIINPHDQPIVIAKTVLEFDKALLALTQEVQTTTALKRVIRKTTMAETSTSGQVQLVLGLDPQDRSTPVAAAITLATLTLSTNGVPSVEQTIQVTIPASSIKLINDRAIALNVNPGVLSVTLLTAAPTPTPTPTPLPDSTPTPTQAASPTDLPNGCNGTCGSNSNCGGSFYCYLPDPTNKPRDGFCRNPSCSTVSSCNCPLPTPTRIPTPRSTVTPRPTPSPTLRPTLQPTTRPTLASTLYPRAYSSPTPTPVEIVAQPQEEGLFTRLLSWLKRLFSGK